MPILQIRKVRQTELKPKIQEFLNGKQKPELWLPQCFLFYTSQKLIKSQLITNTDRM